ncbi:MAG: hypothetical protein HC781_06105 [Leptolyngbyaceae cyanobacterium CSU_1_4]|nr:hypothetical protein [Leptolyngbyaceae cyanobacterium CSU_1_4]
MTVSIFLSHNKEGKAFVRQIGVVFNKKALESNLTDASLGQALNDAAMINLPGTPLANARI